MPTVVIVTCALLAAGAATAHAYLDPGSGSYLFQILIAGLLGSAFLLKTFWRRIGAWLRRRLGRDR